MTMKANVMVSIMIILFLISYAFQTKSDIDAFSYALNELMYLTVH